MHTIKALLVGATVMAAGCTPTQKGETIEGLSAEPATSAAIDALEERRAMYAEVFKQAERQGALLGGLRGALVGALVRGEDGVVVGAILGTIIGSSYSVTVAERLLQERDEFLNRQEIIENILNASKMASERSVEDAELVSRALSAHTHLAEAIDPETHRQVTESIGIVRRAVELRAVMTEEALREAKLPEEEARQVRLEITRQMEALRRIRAQQEIWSDLSHG